MIWRHYVYLHRRATTGEPFYVGKGTLRQSRKVYGRAKAVHKNQRWKHIVARHGLVIEVVAHFVSDAAAQEFECRLIAAIGRADLGRGPLVNVTDGGDGHAGILASAELRAKRSANASRKRSEAWVTSIRTARKCGGNGGVVKRGDRLPADWRAAIAAGKTGILNPQFGKPSPHRRAVLDKESGVVYPSVMHAAEAIGKRFQVVHNWLTGHRKNPTALEFM